MSTAKGGISGQIYLTLRNMILTRELQQGQRIVESKVAKQLNVSITPVREAFSVLSAQGLLTDFPFCGTYVTILSSEAAAELIAVRKSIETECADLAFPKLTSKDADYLEELCKIADIKNSNGEILESIEYDILFHEYLVKKSGNRLILEVWEMIRNRIAFFQSVTRPSNQAAMPLLIDRHKEMLDAIREKDLKSYKKALVNHFNVTMKRGELPSESTIKYK